MEDQDGVHEETRTLGAAAWTRCGGSCWGQSGQGSNHVRESDHRPLFIPWTGINSTCTLNQKCESSNDKSNM